jgi:hypothetical protein
MWRVVPSVTQRAKWVTKNVLTAYKEEGVYIRCGLPGHSIPDYNYLPSKELRLARGRAISPGSFVARSSSSKKIRVSAAQVYIERIV